MPPIESQEQPSQEPEKTPEEQQVEPTETPNLAVNNPFTLDLEGKVVGKEKNGEATTINHADAMTILAYDANNNLVASAVTDINGAYRLRINNAYEGYYYIHIKGLEERNMAADTENPLGIKKVYIKAQEPKVQANFFVKATGVPSIEIIFKQGDCECGHVNPKQVHSIGQSNMKNVSWQIINSSTQHLVYEGKSNEQDVSAQVASLYQNKQDGVYTLTCIYTDANDNSAQTTKTFRIDTKEIVSGQYE